jgi:hypothetical protein
MGHETSLGQDVSANVFHRRANAWRIYSLLTEEETTIETIVATTGIKAKTVRANLSFMAQEGLAERVSRTTWRATSAVVDTSAPAPDGRDYATERRQRHKRERESYHRLHTYRNLRRAWANEKPMYGFDRPGDEGFDPDEPCPIFNPETGEVLEPATPKTHHIGNDT